MTEWSPFRAYGKRRYSLSWQDGLTVAVFAIMGLSLWHASSGLAQYEWQWSLLSDFIYTSDKSGHIQPGLLLRGLATTIRIGSWTIVLSFIIGGTIGILAARKSFLASLPATAFINIFRSTPPLVILFAVYFMAGNLFPAADMENTIRHWPQTAQEIAAILTGPPGQLDRMLAAILALGCYQSAYVAEIMRGSVEAVPDGQMDAANALGFGRCDILRLIVLPQALRIALPPLTGQCISTFKDSALASLISLPDLTFQSLEIMAVSSMTFEIWLTTGAIYLAIGLACATFGRWLETRLTHN